MLALLTGLMAGAVHVISGPDHWVAMAPLSISQPRKAAGLGFRWGLGHAIGVLGIGALALLLRDTFSMTTVGQIAEMIVGLDKVDGLVALEQDRLGQPPHAGSGVDGMAHGEGPAPRMRTCTRSTLGLDCRQGLSLLAMAPPFVVAIAGQIPVEEGQPLRAVGGPAAVADHGLVVGPAAVSAAGPEGRVGRVPLGPVAVLRRLQLGVAAVEVALVVGALDRGGVYFSDSSIVIGVGIAIVSGLVSLTSIVERRCSGRRRGRAGVGAPLTLCMQRMAIAVLLPVRSTLGLLHFGFAGLRRRRRHGYGYSFSALCLTDCSRRVLACVVLLPAVSLILEFC